MIPPELHRFLLSLMTAREFRDWLYSSFELLEPWLGPDDYLRLLELDYSDRHAVRDLRSELRARFVPMAARLDPVRGEPDLMAMIRSAPDSLENYLVLGDALQVAGDPRGEMIALHAGLLRRDSYLLGEALAALLDRHEAALMGPAARLIGGTLHLQWFLGFVARAIVEDQGTFDPETLREILSHPSFALLRELDVSGPLAQMMGTLPATSPLSVLRLFGRRSYDDALDLARVLGTHPHLRVLEVMMGLLELSETEAPNLLFLSIQSMELRTPARLFVRGWPVLERLEIRTDPRRGPSEFHAEASFLEEAHLPRLRHLVLHGFEARAWDQLIEHGLVGQLSTLAIDLDRHGVVTLLERGGAFEHLEELELHAITSLPSGEASRIRTRLPRAVIR